MYSSQMNKNVTQKLGTIATKEDGEKLCNIWLDGQTLTLALIGLVQLVLQGVYDGINQI